MGRVFRPQPAVLKGFIVGIDAYDPKVFLKVWR